MKTSIKLIFFVMAFGLPGCSPHTQVASYEPQDNVSIQVFYDQLSPYGSWINYAPYEYAWIPSVGSGFTPYVTSGHWVYTSYGWTWHSYYGWGWAPFHYGRWLFDSAYGWIWVPSTVWGPGWVTWRYGNGYCGWAPLGPDVAVQVVIDGRHRVADDHWMFVRERDLSKKNIDRYRIERSRNREIVDRTSIPTQTREHQNVQYMPGPDRRDIERNTGRRINESTVNEINKPHNTLRRNQLELFKPKIQEAPRNGQQAAPERLHDPKNISPPSNQKETKRKSQTTPSGSDGNIKKPQRTQRPNR